MPRLLQLALPLALAMVGCDAGAHGRPDEPVVVDSERSDAPTDVCADHDLYADGLCDPSCLHPDPDCLDCSTAARQAVVDLEELGGRNTARLSTEPVTTPDAAGGHLLRVTGTDVDYVVSVDVEHEQGGAFSQFCVVHGLQDAHRMVQLLDGEDGAASSQPPTRTCADAAAQAVLDLEYRAALGVLARDGTRSVTHDEDGREVPTSDSRVPHVELVGVQLGRELLRVHVQRTGDWDRDRETYLVNTRITHDNDETLCEVLGLQNKTHQIDMR